MISLLLVALLISQAKCTNRIRHWAHIGSDTSGHRQRSSGQPAGGPGPDSGSIVNVTSQLGSSAFLHCTHSFTQADPPEVSWLRRRDWHLLTTGKTVFTSDERFQIYHDGLKNDWVLKISFVQLRDRGLYECQISTDKGKISYFVRLHVLQPVARIDGVGVYHVERGSSIRLVCVIREVLTPPSYVYWRHNGDLLNLYKLRSDIEVSLQRGDSDTESTLSIGDVLDTDSGNYTCSADNTRPATVNVFVSEGDKMAAIQRRKGSSGGGRLSVSAAVWVCSALCLFQTLPSRRR